MMKKLLYTNDQPVGLILRLTLGIVLLPHGLQQLLGCFGGNGFSGTMQYYTGMVHLPWLIALLVILVLSFGSLFLILGFAGRLMAALQLIFLLGATFTAHLPFGFFMNWYGMQKGEGFEFHLLGIGVALALMITGSGRFSIDRLITSKQAA